MISLRLRLIAAGTAAVLAALALAAVGLSALFEAQVRRLAADELAVQVDQIAAALARPADRLSVEPPPADPRFDLPFGGRYWQVSAEDVLLRSRSLWDQQLALPNDHAADGQVHVHDLKGPQNSQLMAVERMVTLPASLAPPGRVRIGVAMDTAGLRQAKADFIRGLLPYLALLALALIGAGWVQVTVGLRPLAELHRRVAALRRDPAARLGQAPAEILPLAQGIDALLDARAADLARARHRAGDLAHGLKTPLQALLGEADRLREAGQDTSADDIEQLAQSMRHHVERELARARVAMAAGRGRADPAAIATQLVGVLRRTPDGARLDWRVQCPPALCVAADPSDLAEALGALMENAARHAHSQVTVTGVATQGRVQLALCDDGPGIPAEQRARMLGRGVRADQRGEGSGLGLSIANEIIEAMEGTMTLSDAAPGLCVTLDLRGA